ncbi:MAG: MBL fold metallo-hydrolase [Candidatus Micrarchaeia archaeon]
MEIIFLGTGGGRLNLIDQRRATAGFRVHFENGLKMHAEPGPGALIKCRELGCDPIDTQILLVSHVHIDHSNDTSLMIEAMTEYTKKRRGILLGSSNVLIGDAEFDRCVSRYHQSLLERCVVLRPGTVFGMDGIEIIATETRHDEWDAVGMIIRSEKVKVGYTGDTEYFPALCKIFSGCDLLIINNLQPNGRAIPGHNDSAGSIKILKGAKPKQSVLTHMGTELTREVAEREAAMIERESGVKTVAAYDGMRISLGE